MIWRNWYTVWSQIKTQVLTGAWHSSRCLPPQMLPWSFWGLGRFPRSKDDAKGRPEVQHTTHRCQTNQKGLEGSVLTVGNGQISTWTVMAIRRSQMKVHRLNLTLSFFLSLTYLTRVIWGRTIYFPTLSLGKGEDKNVWNRALWAQSHLPRWSPQAKRVGRFQKMQPWRQGRWCCLFLWC